MNARGLLNPKETLQHNQTANNKTKAIVIDM